jgi:glycosyltransferase involved in cell wall biosynthesis
MYERRGRMDGAGTHRPDTPIRIVHVLGMMERAGVETWLMHILRGLDRTRYQMDFIVHTSDPQAYDAEVRALGSRLIAVPHIHQPLKYAREFSRALRAYGPYDIVHSHVHRYSGFILRLAKRAGVPVRIAHSHLDAADAEAHASTARRLYMQLMHRWLDRNMTMGLAVSDRAARDLFGPGWRRDPRHRLLFCGIDMEPFRTPVNPAEVRAEFGIPADAFVIGHVGRFRRQKNHTFLLQIAAEACTREPNARFLLVGTGEMRPEIERQAAAMGLHDRVVFAGARTDISRLMLGAMDAFLLPSLYEGLPLVLMEAQAAGLPCVYSDTIADEAAIVPVLVRQLPLTLPASGWAEALLALRRTAPAIGREEAFAIAAATPFNARTSWHELERVYAG